MKEHPTPNLQLEPVRLPGADAFNLQPKAVKRWLDGLPMANPGEAGRLLYCALKEVNGLDVDASLRFDFLEALRRPIRLIVQSLDRHYVGIPFPLPPTNRRIADLARTFHSEMSIGYVRVVDQLSRRHGIASLTRRGMLVAATYRALLYRGRVLLKAFQVYAPYPQHLWRELHELYSFARRTGIAGKTVDDPENALVKSRSIEDIYKQALLLALSNPYRLRQGDVVRVCNALELWSPYCRLNPVNSSGGQPQGLFAVRFESDEQPAYLDGQGPRGLSFVLDTSALGGLLREQDAYLEDPLKHPSKAVLKALPPNFPHPLLHRVMLSWGMMVQRGYSRMSGADDNTVDVALGLSSLFHFTGGDEELLRASPDDRDTELTTAAMIDWAEPSQITHNTHCCRIIDESAGGYRLAWCANEQLRMQVGELIGLHTKGTPDDQWSVGVVRWMRAEDEQRMEVGIQMLSPSVTPITARVCNAEGRCGEHQSCLLLPTQEGTDQPATLIAPTFFNNFATRLMLIDGPRKQVVALTNTIENTGAFVQFDFNPETGSASAKPTESETAAPEPEPPPPRRRQEESEFESIWHSL